MHGPRCHLRDISYICPLALPNEAYSYLLTCLLYTSIDAYLNDETVVIGSFRTQIAHNKLIFKLLRDDMTRAILSDEENEFIERHIPETHMLTHDNIHKYEVIEDRFNWIVKPADSYASKGVFAGIEAKDAEEWLAFLSKHMDTGYLLQRYITPYESDNIDLLWDKPVSYTHLDVYKRQHANIVGKLFKPLALLKLVEIHIRGTGIHGTALLLAFYNVFLGRIAVVDI